MGEGDQSILNMLFFDSYIEINETFNYQIGFVEGRQNKGMLGILEKSINPLPKNFTLYFSRQAVESIFCRASSRKLVALFFYGVDLYCIYLEREG